jgi:hypothetical protein
LVVVVEAQLLIGKLAAVVGLAGLELPLDLRFHPALQLQLQWARGE